MEIYKFLYPHFNPLLLATPIRQHELSELTQTCTLLRRALEHAERRNSPGYQRTVNQEQLHSALKAIRYLETVLQGMEEGHKGDTVGNLEDLARERSTLPGWKSWATILLEQLKSDETPEIIKKAANGSSK